MGGRSGDHLRTLAFHLGLAVVKQRADLRKENDKGVSYAIYH